MEYVSLIFSGRDLCLSQLNLQRLMEYCIMGKLINIPISALLTISTHLPTTPALQKVIKDNQNISFVTDGINHPDEFLETHGSNVIP